MKEMEAQEGKEMKEMRMRRVISISKKMKWREEGEREVRGGEEWVKDMRRGRKRRLRKHTMDKVTSARKGSILTSSIRALHGKVQDRNDLHDFLPSSLKQ